MDFAAFYLGASCSASLVLGLLMLSRLTHQSAERERRIDIARRRHRREAVLLLPPGEDT